MKLLIPAKLLARTSVVVSIAASIIEIGMVVALMTKGLSRRIRRYRRFTNK